MDSVCQRQKDFAGNKLNQIKSLFLNKKKKKIGFILGEPDRKKWLYKKQI